MCSVGLPYQPQTQGDPPNPIQKLVCCPIVQGLLPFLLPMLKCISRVEGTWRIIQLDVTG